MKNKQLLKQSLLLFVVSIPIFALIAIYFLYSIFIELESKFYNPVNTVPTKLYSRIFWLHPQKAIHLEELKARLKKRKYKESPKSSPLGRGMFRVRQIIKEENKETPLQRVDILLRNFPYPESIREKLLSENKIEINKHNTYSVFIKDQRITHITKKTKHSDKEEEIEALALEPILIARLNNNSTKTREYIPLKDIPYTLLQAIVSVEDRRFLEHSGVDIKGIFRSILINLRAGAYRQGASTITQQMVKNLYLTREKTIRRKLKEIIMAIMIELRYSKDKILEKYFNEAYFGQLGNLEIHGVSLAAKHYFGKSIKELSIGEQALLAGIIRGPSYYSPYRNFNRAKRRQEFVLKKMYEEGIIIKKVYEKAVKKKLVFKDLSIATNTAVYFTDFVKQQLLKETPNKDFMGTGYTIFSTMDPYYQKIVEEEVEEGVLRIEENLKKNQKLTINNEKALPPLQAVFILIGHGKNDVLAVVGSRSSKNSIYNRALLMKRQIGSLIKPFVYLTALIYGRDKNTGAPINAISTLEDSPFEYKYGNKVWKPKNHEKKHYGLVTLRYALAKSINIPAARLATEIGIEKVANVAESAGISIKEKDILPSLALGSLEASPIDLLRSFSTLANYGIYKDITSILLITDSEEKPTAQFIVEKEKVLPTEETANLVEMMRSVFTEGTARRAKSAKFFYPAIGKTGTSNDYRDAWFVGFTHNLLALAWVGYDKDSEETKKARTTLNLTGASAALPLWLNVMKRIYHKLPHQEIVFPEGAISLHKVDMLTEGLSDGGCLEQNIVEEYFTKRNKPYFTCTE